MANNLILAISFVFKLNSNLKTVHLSKEAIDVDRFELAKPVDPENGLDVVRWVPGGIKHNHSIGSNQVDTQSSRLGGDQEQTSTVTKQQELVRQNNSPSQEVLIKEVFEKLEKTDLGTRCTVNEC